MAANVDLDGYQDGKYFARSWALLTGEPGWLGQLLAMWAAGLVPIVGALGVSGYIAEWARLTAWNANMSPARNGGTLGGYIKSGWRAFLVGFGWMFCWGVIAGLIMAIPLLGPALSALVSLAGIAIGVVIGVAVLRATIYQQVGAGYKVSTILQMVENDAAGLLRILAIELIGGAILGVVGTVLFFLVLIPTSAGIIVAAEAFIDAFESDSEFTYRTITLMMDFFATLMPSVLATIAAVSFFGNMLRVVVSNAVGLWIRQFNVPAWGGNDDPLPASIPSAQYAYPQSAPAAPGDAQAQQYAAPGQNPYAYGDTDYGQATYGQVGQAYTPPNQEGSAGQGPWQQQ